jgi:hypothetical protein
MNNKILSVDVAKMYIQAELSRIFSALEIQEELSRGINGLSEKELLRLLEALSFTYRLNPMFWYLSDDSYTWRKEEVNCDKLILTGMKPEIDAITHSDTIQNNPLKFRDYLLNYFGKYPSNDPEGLGQFRPSGKKIRYPTIFLIEENGKLKLIDGSNRLMATLLQGGTKISAIIGTKTANGKPHIGDSTFWLLRRLYERGDPKEKEAVLLVVKKLMRENADGRKAIEEYWVKHVKDEEIKKVGRSLLS